ncbi:MAG: biosynthetic peptidoglycan transglycosylase [Clostridia bacterium]
MKKIFKFLKTLFIVFILTCIFIVGVITINGYNMYKDAVNKISIEDRVDEIRIKKGYVKIEQIPKEYKEAVISIEDHRFYNHSGIDYISTFRAFFNNIQAKSLAEGGSTITQQLSKNMYFTQEKKFVRKVAELFVAFKLEKKYSKNDILELYINLSYYGNGYNGIDAACKGYFKKEPINMTLDESTLLAGIPNAPSVYALTANPELSRQRQKQVLNSMVKYNYLTDELAKEVMNKY